MTDVVNRAAARNASTIAWWPSALGALAAAALVTAAWTGHLSWRQLTGVLVAGGLVYLGSAALGSRRAAWGLFAVTVVVIGLGGQLAIIDPIVGLSALAALLAVLGVARGRVVGHRDVAIQTAAMAVVLLVALAAVDQVQPWVGVLLAAGLLAHTGWDAAHHRSGRVVVRSMSEFCAVLDALLAAGVLVLAFA